MSAAYGQTRDALLDGLNPEQRAAVVHGEGPLLVLAGAGSGKTRVITHRIARLLRDGTPAGAILAVTFTNKAAGEMLERLERLCGPQAGGLWVSTFHAAGVRILRRDGHKLGLPRGFTILDESDQLTVMKRALAELGIAERLLAPKEALARVDRYKNAALDAAAARQKFGGGAESDPAEAAALRAYARYESALQAQGAVDFGDLILRVVELLRRSPDTRDLYRRRFRHVLVDEFQDTNPAQYELLRLLCPDTPSQANLCVVGDDDQSIYRWRGAEVANILDFPQAFPGAQVVKLERNYRSTPRILAVAHAVISRNGRRADKRLWTEGEPGEQPRVHLLPDDRLEAARAAELLSQSRSDGTPWREMAVFYRTNAQSRLLEEALRQRRVPYAVVRGTSFYDRAEIRDLASWLRLLVNPHGDGDFVRAVGAVPRGIGDTTLEKLAAHARTRGVSLYTAVSEGGAVPGLSPAARGKLTAFVTQLEALRQRAAISGAGPLARAVAQESGFLDRLGADPRGEGEERLQNVQEFLRAADEFDATWSSVTGEAEDATAQPVTAARRAALLALRGDDDTPAPSALEAFLAQLAVLGAADESVDGERVSLMTLHTAKGLEFDTVVLAGMEERVFPTARALGDTEAIAEERRLCYVGMTRARCRLHLLLARQRALFGEAAWNRPSRFLYELPQEHVRGLEVLPREDADDPFEAGSSRWGGSGTAARYGAPVVPRPSPRPPVTSTTPRLPESSTESHIVYDAPDARPAPRLRPPGEGTTVVRETAGELVRGATVQHAVFGQGRVLATQGTGDSAKVTVHFPAVGPKVVVARHLQPL